MGKHLEWLKQELAQWRAEGLVDEALARCILARYPFAAERGWGRVIFSAIGAILVGLAGAHARRGRMLSQAFNATGVID